MEKIIVYAQIIASILLVITILLQQRSSALSAAFGGEGSIFSTRRGAEKWLLIASVILSILFFGLAIINLII